MATANNDRFLRYWWEINQYHISKNYNEDCLKWVRYAKGGEFNKWYGNLWLVVNWENNGDEMRATGRAVFRNQQYYFKEGITYSATSSKGTSFRVLPRNCIYDVKGASAFIEGEANSFYILALLNCKLTSYIINCLNSTVETQVGDIKRVPYAAPNDLQVQIIEKLVKETVKQKKRISSIQIYESEFSKSPFLYFKKSNLLHSVSQIVNWENHLTTQILINEAIINEKIFEVYELTEHDKAMVLAKEGESIGGLPVLAEARDAYLSETEATKNFPLDNIREFIEALPVKDFTDDEREAVESGFPTLYQSNNDLEAFCTRHQVNPINVWYWFKESGVIPKQRMHTLAMEFLADMIREILMDDEDGIIPLVPNAGEKVILDRIEDKFREKGFTSAQYASFDTVLGRPLHDYINKHFFAELSDHLNLFMYLPKTPFIWHLSSGPLQGFDCYIIIYKWSRDNLMGLRSVYIEHRERALVNRQSDISGNESAEAQNEKDLIFKQLKEIEDFKVKIDDLLAENYNPILDDGVGKNIAPLQKRKMIPYEVLTAGQLKKYLNADW